MRRRPWILGFGAIATFVVCAVFGVWLGVVLPRRARYATLTRELEGQVADFHRQRWIRPVLRGRSVEGNAFERAQAAVAPFESLPDEPFLGIVGLLEARDPSPELRALAERHAVALERYRSASQAGWSFGDYPVERGFEAGESPFLEHARAARLLAARASLAPPEECVPIATDLIRLAQDTAVGRSFVAHTMPHHLQLVVAVLPRCLIEADEATRAQAVRELGILAEHPTPVGYALEIQALSVAELCARLLRPVEHIPTDHSTLSTWWTATDKLDACEVFVGDPQDRRRFGARYPEDIAELEAWERRVAAMPDLILPWPFSQVDFLRRDAATVTRVRMLLAMARLLSGEPRSIIEEASMQDALTGAPLGMRETEAGLELESAGIDGRLGTVDDISLLVLPR